MEKLHMLDEFSNYYANFLDGTYDCVDRIVLNAYFQMGQRAAGFRTWWRQLKGSDDNLDNAHLMRMAGRLSRRVRAHAKAKQILLIDCKSGERKHEIAEQYVPTDPGFIGVYLILVGRAPAPLWDIRCSSNGKIVNIVRKEPWRYVNHYSFYIVDPEWGRLVIKLCGHPPFGAQIILNGHEYVARQLQKQNLGFAKEGNCFTQIPDVTRLAQVADTLCVPDTIGRLSQVCDRWIYSACLCFALDLAEQERSGFHYNYSVYQTEYSRNLLFRRGSILDQVFHGVIERTRVRLDVKVLKTIFGTKKRPYRHKGKKSPRVEVVLERPAYDLTVFKIHFGKLTAKMYTKGECVLRIEIVVHNTRALPCGRSLPKFPDIILRLKDILNHFLQAVHRVDVSCIDVATWETLHTASQVGRMRVGGIDLNQARMQAVINAVISLAAAPQGFRSSDVAVKVRAIRGLNERAYTARQAAYDLKKLRGKHLVRLVPKSRRYEVVPEGLQTLTALLVLRDKVIKPVLAGVGKPKPGPKPKNRSPLDVQYGTVHAEMRNLLEIIGVAV